MNIKSRIEDIIVFLSSQSFTVWVAGAKERKTNILGLIQLLHNFSDFGKMSVFGQKQYLIESIENRSFYIDAEITCTIPKKKL